MSRNTAFSTGKAKALVEQIADDHGYLPEEILDTMTDKTRKKVVDAMLKKDRIIGSSVVTLAKNLYTSNARFVFELLQNADDNHYSNATTRGDDPYISFEVFPEHIVLECNEDGFTTENLTAICNVGKSSKTGAQGYVGEKGIGFKSVFMAAYKVHIQSASFSFSFMHRQGDSGMGMISPVWEKSDSDVPVGVTRMTLFLHNVGTAAEIQARRRPIVQQFQEIQDTHLLFLKNIRRIQIKFRDENRSVTTSTTFEVQTPATPDSHCVSLRKLQNSNAPEYTHYHVTKNLAHRLAKNENRTYSNKEEIARAYSTADVTLAFPLTQDLVPITETQQIYAFLPIRDMGFRFLIQTDFVTQANRQDIVTTSARNIDLVDWIAATFVEAMLELCSHATLQYVWMRYLPQEGDFPWDNYWKSLVTSIKSKIATTPLLRPRSEQSLRLVAQLRRHIKGYSIGDDGEPTFADVWPEMYLSKHYQECDMERLTYYGLAPFSIQQLLTLVEADLYSPDSRIRSSLSTNAWHAKAASLVSLVFVRKHTNVYDRTRKLQLIPVQKGRWISAESSSVPLAFPTVDGIDIPSDLDLNLISPEAVKTSKRKKLFGYLGATELTVKRVRELILNKYTAVANHDAFFGACPAFGAPTHFREKISLAHLSFLYLTHDSANTPIQIYRSIRLITHDGSLKAPRSQEVYVADDHQYGTKELLRAKSSRDTWSDGAKGFSVPFVSGYYLEHAPLPSQESGAGMGWSEWLENCLGVLSRPKLISEGKLTDMFKYIIENCQEDLLGIFQYYWPWIEKDVSANESIQSHLSESMVRGCKGQAIELSKSYLPYPKLKERCLDYLDEEYAQMFPFLDLTNTLAPQKLQDWEFLHTTFGVGKEENLEFYLEVLRCAGEVADFQDQRTLVKVYDLYERIHAKSRETRDADGRKEQEIIILDTFENENLLLVPDAVSHTADWESPSKCRWDAPAIMTTVHPIKHLFKDIFGHEDTDRAALPQFLRTTLQIGPCTWEDLVEELKHRKGKGAMTPDTAIQIYNHLAQLTEVAQISIIRRLELRRKLDIDKLIFASNSWHGISDCLWSSATDIKGETTLNKSYPDLEPFFVEFLGVKRMTLHMVYDKLKDQGASDESTASEVKHDLMVFNSLLLLSKQKPDPAPILAGRLFPVKSLDGNVGLCRGESDFAIADRKSLGATFAGKAKLLDFSFDEVLRLQPTLEWLGLENRYLSVAVQEVSGIIADSERPVSSPQRDIKTKAHALCRIAAHFKSPRAQPEENVKELYEFLKRAQVLETDGIASELHLVQDGHTIVIPTSRSELHIEDAEDTLRIYIPSDAKRQERCYISELPSRFLDWMMQRDTHATPDRNTEKASRVISSVLNVSHSNVEHILENDGITDIDFPDDITPEAASEESGAGSVSSDMVLRSQTPTRPPPAHQSYIPATPGEEVTDAESDAVETPASSIFSEPSPQARRMFRDAEHGNNLPARSQSPPARASQDPFAPAGQPVRPSLLRYGGTVPIVDVDDARYLSILVNVVEAARRTVFPVQGSFEISSLQQALPDADGEPIDMDGELPMFRSTGPMERDRKVGAAGELFVFELLSRLDPVLPQFSRENWESTIRKYASVHPDYTDMLPWQGRETADITYDDTSGVLTEILIDHGYLDDDTWNDRRPKYFIEVKTTVGPCETPFFMSKYQYNRMQHMSNGADGPQDQESIYVIFRVSKLRSKSIQLNIYVDPEVMRQEQELVFTTDTWSVVPGPGLD